MTNVLLTGQPHSGKSTLLETFVKSIERKRGFFTKEILENDERVGFELVDDMGRHAVLARVDLDSSDKVSRYGVDVPALEDFLDRFSIFEDGELLYIDEAGQMELLSEYFKDTFRVYLNAENDFVGTVTAVYDEPFVQEIKERSDVKVIEVTSDTRDLALQELRESYK